MPSPSSTTAPAQPARAEARGDAGPRVWDDMTVEVALSVMAGALTGRLLVCDEDGRQTGLVTLAQLAAVRDSSAYTDRVRLRDVLGDPGRAAVAASPADGTGGGRSSSAPLPDHAPV